MRLSLPAPLKYIWAFPCTALGLMVSLPLCILGARPRVVLGVIEVAFNEGDHKAIRTTGALPFTGITLGHVVIAPTHDDHEALRSHERVHVNQYEAWGILFLLLYPASSVVQLLRGRRPYLDNYFEVQAYSTVAKQLQDSPSSDA